MVTGTEPTTAQRRGLETFLTTMIDHGLNTSTFTARVVTSAESDLVSAATAAIGALAGTLHGRDRAVIFDMLSDIDDPAAAEQWVRKRLAAGERIMGFGHPVYRVEDPRVAVVSAAAQRLYETMGDEAFVETVQDAKHVIVDVLSDSKPDAQIQPNVDFNTGVLLHGVGIPRELFTPTVALSRVGGWMAHCLEQREDNQLIRPVSRYVGETDRTWTPRDRRYLAGDTIFQQPLQSGALEPVSDTLAVLSEPNRLEILLVLSDIETPAAYSTLRAATSIEDKGRFNYHLRQLRDYFVADHEEGYLLTETGQAVVEQLLTDETFRGMRPD